VATQLFRNNVITALSADLSTGGTTVNLAPGGGDLFPSPSAGQYFLATIHTVTYDQWEVIKVTSTSGDTFTNVERGYEGTQYSWQIDHYVSMNVTKDTLDRIRDNTQVARTKSDNAVVQVDSIISLAVSMADLAVTYTSEPGSTYVPDVSDSNVHHIVLEENITMDLPVWDLTGNRQALYLYVRSNNYTASWDSGYTWIGSAPTFTGDNTYVVEVFTIDAGGKSYAKLVETLSVHSGAPPVAFYGYAFGLDENNQGIDKINLLTHTLTNKYLTDEFYDSAGDALDFGLMGTGVVTNRSTALYIFAGRYWDSSWYYTRSVTKFLLATEVMSYLSSIVDDQYYMSASGAHDQSTGDMYLNSGTDSTSLEFHKLSASESLSIESNAQNFDHPRNSLMSDDGTKCYIVGGFTNPTKWDKFVFATGVFTDVAAVGANIYSALAVGNDNSGTKAWYWGFNSDHRIFTFATDVEAAASGQDDIGSITSDGKGGFNDTQVYCALAIPFGGRLWNYNTDTMSTETGLNATDHGTVGYGTDYAHT